MAVFEDRRGTGLLGVFFALSALFSAPACVDKAKCDEAIQVTRDALAKEQPEIARQWRDRAWKICNDTTLTSPLDKEIVDKEAVLAKRAADSAKQIADASQERLNQATAAWKAYDGLDAKDRTSAKLDEYKVRAARMTQGLPPEYAKQIDDYNAAQYARRLGTAQAAK
jgi:hypothetical protein